MSGVEGTGSSQLIQVLRQITGTKGLRVELGTVTSAPPALKVQVDNMPVELLADDLMVAYHLTAHDLKVTVTGLDGERTISFKDQLLAGDRVVLLEMDGGQTYLILDKEVKY